MLYDLLRHADIHITYMIPAVALIKVSRAKAQANAARYECGSEAWTCSGCIVWVPFRDTRYTEFAYFARPIRSGDCPPVAPTAQSRGYKVNMALLRKISRTEGSL